MLRKYIFFLFIGFVHFNNRQKKKKSVYQHEFKMHWVNTKPSKFGFSRFIFLLPKTIGKRFVKSTNKKKQNIE